MLLGTGAAGTVPGRRVAVTGMGVLACCGIGLDDFWAGLLGPAPGPVELENGRSGRIVPGFDPTQWFGPKEVRRADRFAQLSVAAAEMALEDAGGGPGGGEVGGGGGGGGGLAVDPALAGVIFASGVGGLGTLESQIAVFLERGPRRVSPFLVPMMMSNAGAATISMRRGWHGPCETIVTACAAATHAIAAAARLVASGRCEVAVGGGAEASITGVGAAAFSNMTALSVEDVSRPFDRRRDGFIMAEGAGALVLEDMERALGRGARIYAEIAGAGSTADVHHITAPAPGGAGAAACMELAMADAQLSPADIGHINAHGTSTPLNDLSEAEAINKVFGRPGPPVTSTKGVTGHVLGGAGAVEAVATVLAIEHRLIPPTAGHVEPDPEIELDVVHGAARPWEPAPSLSNSFGFGGHNGTLVISPVTD